MQAENEQAEDTRDQLDRTRGLGNVDRNADIGFRLILALGVILNLTLPRPAGEL